MAPAAPVPSLQRQQLSPAHTSCFVLLLYRAAHQPWEANSQAHATSSRAFLSPGLDSQVLEH